MYEVASTGGKRGSYDIANVREIARLLPVTVDGERLISQERVDELVESHVRTLAWAVDREVAERDRRQFMPNGIEPTEVFRSQFRHSIGRNGQGGAVFACGQGRRFPIH